MYSRRLAANAGVLQLLLASSSRSVRVGMVNQSVQPFSFVNVETVSVKFETLITNGIERVQQEEEGQKGPW